MMSSSAVKEPPHTKEEETSLSLLPDDLVISCLAQVPRSYYAALSLVSKRYHSLVVSPDLYKARSLLGYTKKYLYVCLSTGHNTASRWFVLRREKSKTLEKTVLTPILSFLFQPPKRSSVVALDWGIYVIGGCIKGKPTSDVLLLDCRTNTWRNVPSMKVARSLAAVGVVYGKIYVFGGCKNIDSLSWGEVFDPNTQSWDTLVPMSDRRNGDGLIRKSFVMDEKVYAFSFSDVKSIVYYSPSECKWGRANLDLEPYLQRHQCVMVEKLLYSLDESGKLFWYEKKEFKWKELKGFDTRVLYPFTSSLEFKLRNFGENIVVFWCVDVPGCRGSKISYAEISLERRREGDEIWGKVECSGVLINTFGHHGLTHNVRVSHSVSVNL